MPINTVNRENFSQVFLEYVQASIRLDEEDLRIGGTIKENEDYEKSITDFVASLLKELIGEDWVFPKRTVSSITYPKDDTAWVLLNFTFGTKGVSMTKNLDDTDSWLFEWHESIDNPEDLFPKLEKLVHTLGQFKKVLDKEV